MTTKYIKEFSKHLFYNHCLAEEWENSKGETPEKWVNLAESLEDISLIENVETKVVTDLWVLLREHPELTENVIFKISTLVNNE